MPLYYRLHFLTLIYRLENQFQDAHHFSEHIDYNLNNYLQDKTIFPCFRQPQIYQHTQQLQYLLRYLKSLFDLLQPYHQSIQNTNITAQAVAALSHHGAVAEVLIVNRVSYPAAFTDGRTPQEIEPKGQAAKETAKLWAFIHTYLNNDLLTQNKQERSCTNG